MDELEKALTPKEREFLDMCRKAMGAFDPVDCYIGKDLPLIRFLTEIVEYENLSSIALNAKHKEDAICGITSITRDISLAVGFVLGQEIDITVPEAKKCLRAIKKIMKEKQAIPWMARERRARG